MGRSQCRGFLNFKVRDRAHLQPAVALAITKLLKSPEEASRNCGEKNFTIKWIEMSGRENYKDNHNKNL